MKIMKHIINYLGSLLAVVLISTTFAACSDKDGAGSSNVGLGIKTFFPTKVVTNQPMTINGSGFDAVTEIEFPNGVKVTNFEIVSDDMIRVEAPSGIAAEGGSIIVRTADSEAESSQSLTIGHTVVTGIDKEAGDILTGGDLINIYGKDLEFIKAVEFLDVDGNPQLVDQKDFYRKGTSNTVVRVPVKNIYTGSFIAYIYTYDGQKFPMPELSYKPGADDGHYEIVRTSIWKNDGSLGEINWSGDYRFAGEGFGTGEECYVIPADVWAKMKTETFYVTVKGAAPQIRVTTGWWSTTWTGNDIQPGNELLTDNGDGTFTLAVNFGSDPILDILDAQHLLFTGGGYTVEEIYFIEIVKGGGASETVVWQGDGSDGEVNWNGTYRFSNEEAKTGEEIYAIPMDQWEKIKTGTFYLDLQGAAPQIRVTDGWWSTTWTGNDIQPGSEYLTDNGDGTWTLEVNFGSDPLVDVLDAQHLLFTGSGYTPLKLYYK